jgi:hypothetical protein
MIDPDNFKEDVAGDVHMRLYGCSDKINAACNRFSREYQEGYHVGANSMAYMAEQIIKEEWELRQEVDDDLATGFLEWKRGFWGARSQCILFVNPHRKRKSDKFFGASSDGI